jgi:heme-degrading monooxygenase HmoA
MFARILVFEVKLDQKDEFVAAVRERLLPILRKQVGFLEFLPFLQKSKQEKVFTVSLWTTQQDAERYEKNVYPEVIEVLRPFLLAPAVVSHWNLETTLCDRFVDALAV